MQTVTDDVLVFELLEKVSKADFDTSLPHVDHFEFDDALHFFIFYPTGKEKGCRLFKTPLPLHYSTLQKELLPVLLWLPDNAVRNEALTLLEELLSQGKNTALFFDGH